MTLDATCSHDDLLATLFPSPRRVVSVDPSASESVDLGRLFPRAVVLDATIDAASEWAGWPDLLWFGTSLSSTRLDPARAVRSAWRALPEGALVVAFELAAGDPATRRRCARLGLEAHRDIGPLLRDCFAVLASLEAGRRFGAWPLRALVGVKSVDRDW